MTQSQAWNARRRPVRPRTGARLAAAAIRASEPAPLASPGLRAGVLQRCLAMGVRLTDKRRRIVEIFDKVASPIDLEEVWWKCVELEIDVNRSSLHRLTADLVEAGVLHELAPGNRRARFATPPAVAIEIVSSEHEATSVQEPALTELLIEALSRQGMDAANRRIVITLQD